MTPFSFDLINFIRRSRDWSRETFGPGRRTEGLCRHIEKELGEIRAEPLDLEEWIDVVILALDGAWRAGHEPDAIVLALLAKQSKNFDRTWPAPMGEDHPVEHVRERGGPMEMEPM